MSSPTLLRRGCANIPKSTFLFLWLVGVDGADRSSRAARGGPRRVGGEGSILHRASRGERSLAVAAGYGREQCWSRRCVWLALDDDRGNLFVFLPVDVGVYGGQWEFMLIVWRWRCGCTINRYCDRFVLVVLVLWPRCCVRVSQLRPQCGDFDDALCSLAQFPDVAIQAHSSIAPSVVH